MAKKMETEYLRVDSNTAIYVELHCIENGLDAGQKSLLRKEVLDLTKDDIQQYVEKFNRKKKKTAQALGSPARTKNTGQVIRGENVKFLYEFSKMSVTHRILTRDMKRGSKFKSCEVFPERLVIYYQPYCKTWNTMQQDSSQVAISCYFKKPTNQTEVPPPMKTLLGNIVSKGASKLKKKKKWEVVNVCEKNPITVPERPDPFKQMAEEDERKLDTRMKIALVKDNLLMLQADLAGHQKENIRPEQLNDVGDFEQQGFTASPCSKELMPYKEQSSYIDSLDRGDLVGSSSLNKVCEKSSTEDKFNRHSGDSSVAADSDKCDNPNKTDTQALELPTEETVPTETDSFDEPLPNLSYKSDTPESPTPGSSDKSYTENAHSGKIVNDDPDADLPLAFHRIEDVMIGDKPENIYDAPNAFRNIDEPSNLCESVLVSDSVNEKEKVGQPVVDHSQKQLLSNKPSSKTATRLSRKVAMIELSDSDSDENGSRFENLHGDALDRSEHGQVPLSDMHKEDPLPEVNVSKRDQFVFKMPKLSRSARSKETRSKSTSSNCSSKGVKDSTLNEDGEMDIGTNKYGQINSEQETQPQSSHDRGSLTDSDCDLLPTIVHYKRTVLKRKKKKASESKDSETLPYFHDQDDSFELPTITSSKSKLRRLGPKIKANKSSKGGPPNLLMPADIQSTSKPHSVPKNTTDTPKATDTTDFDNEITGTDESSSPSNDLKHHQVEGPCVIEDDTNEDDRLLLEISSVNEVKYLTAEQLEYLVTSNVDYVRDIFKGKTYCERHEKYKGGKRQQILLRNDVPMGQFREAQHDIVMNILMKAFCADSSKYFDYVCKVTLPEMLIKVCMDVQHLSHSDAENALDKVNMSQMVNI